MVLHCLPLLHCYCNSHGHLHYITSTTSPPLHHLHYITSTTLPPLHHLHYITFTTFTSSPPLHHLHYITSTTSPPLHHLHYITSTTSPPLHHLHYITSATSPPLHHLHYITSTSNTSPPLHHLHYITSTTSPPLHHLHYITSTTSPPLHYLHYITSTTSPPLHLAWSSSLKRMSLSSQHLSSSWPLSLHLTQPSVLFSYGFHCSPSSSSFRKISSTTSALHKHHNLNNLGIRHAGNLAKPVRNNRFCFFFNYSENRYLYPPNLKSIRKNRFSLCRGRRLHTLSACTEQSIIMYL